MSAPTIGIVSSAKPAPTSRLTDASLGSNFTDSLRHSPPIIAVTSPPGSSNNRPLVKPLT
jgi:hypothetical protein